MTSLYGESVLFLFSSEGVLSLIIFLFFSCRTRPSASHNTLCILAFCWLTGSAIALFSPVELLPPLDILYLLPAISLLVIGALLAFDVQLSVLSITFFAFNFGFLHGFSHGIILGNNFNQLRVFELLAVPTAIYGAGALINRLMRHVASPIFQITFRIFGGWTATTGILMGCIVMYG
ncbi:HupE/UreJ family protein [Desulfosediminicola sp.]|uniref:HupE/UreJ family protein n=1 Tax=Desulfosediminicola sp. TaxID=2886825 RepID=UPI003AF24DC8